MKIDEKIIRAIIDEYNKNVSLYQLSKKYKLYPITISRLLEKNGIELRHDVTKKGECIVKDGEKLIEWAKAQKRLVTKEELATVLGKTRLSHSYFVKYPELGQYVQVRERKAWKYYIHQLYEWLKENNIPFKPNDKTVLNGLSVHALLLGEYSNIALQIDIKPQTLSKASYKEMIDTRVKKAKQNKITLLFLKETNFINLDEIKTKLDAVKKSNRR